MVTGPSARQAFDLTREDPRLRDRYGRTAIGQACLLARRLVEAGVTFVTVTDGGWDHHGQVFAVCRQQLPPLDAAVATLVEDLHDRGLADRVLVLVWGEFGRTPAGQRQRRAATTGRAPSAPCSPAAASGRARSSARPTARASARPSGPCVPRT